MASPGAQASRANMVDYDMVAVFASVAKADMRLEGGGLEHTCSASAFSRMYNGMRSSLYNGKS